MIPELGAVLLAIVSVLLLALAMLLRPGHAIVPESWYVNGVTPEGVVRVRRAPPPERPCPLGPNGCVEPEAERELEMQIYCTGGSRAVVNARVAGCTR